MPDHITEPPGPEPPALVAALLDPSGERATRCFRRNTFRSNTSRPHRGFADISVKRSWFGLRTKDVSDLVLKPRPANAWALKPFERQVFDAVVHATKDQEHFHLTEFKSEIKSESAYYSSVFDNFTGKVTDAVDKAGWWIARGFKPAAIACAAFWLVVAAAAVTWIFIAPDRSVGLPWRTFILAAIAIAAGVNGLVLVGFLIQRRGWERRSKRGAVAASKWAAFRRFLPTSQA